MGFILLHMLYNLIRKALQLLDILASRICVLQTNAGYDCDLSVALVPQVFAEQLRLALEAFVLFGIAEP